MAASFPWFNNPWEGVEALPDDGAGLPLTDESFVALEAEVAAAFNAAELPELIDDRDDEPGEVPAFMLDDPLEDAVEVAVDACILAAQSAARIVAELEVEEAAEAADAAVVLRLDALGISGPAAVSLIAPSVDALGGVADEVLGPLHTAEAAAARGPLSTAQRSTKPGPRSTGPGPGWLTWRGLS